MSKIALWLDPRRLENPDTDLRYVIPDLLVDLSGGVLSDDGYDYVENPENGPGADLLIFLNASDVEKALTAVLEMIEVHRVMENDLHTIVVAVDQGQGYRVAYPAGFSGRFPV